MSSAATRDDEPIVSLVKTFRKLEGCSTSQLIECMTALPRLFQQHGELSLLINALKTELTRSYKSISAQLFQNMIALLPSEEALDTKDTVSQCDHDEEDEPIMNLLTMPKTLKLLCCNFLVEKELYAVQGSCRRLMLETRDPNALYHLKMRYRHRNRYHSHPFFSRIKSLELHFVAPINSKWCDSVVHLDACLKAVRSLSTDRIIYANLRQLKLFGSSLDKAVIRALLKCARVESLSLHCMRVGVDFEASFISELSWRPFPMQNLRLLEIDIKLLNFGHFVNFMMSGSTHKVTLKIVGQLGIGGQDNDTTSVFSVHSRLGVAALMNVECISVDTSTHAMARSLVNNVAEALHNVNRSKFGSKYKRLRSFDAAFVQDNSVPSAHFDKGFLCPIRSIASFCIQSSLFLSHYVDSTAHECLADWVTQMARTDRLQLQPGQVPTEVHIRVEDMSSLNAALFKFMLDNTSDTAALKQKAVEFAHQWRDQYRKWVAPWLQMNEVAMRTVNMRSLDISFSTHIEWDLAQGDVGYDAVEIEQYGEEEVYLGYIECVADTWQSPVGPMLRAQLTNLIDERCKLEFDEEHFTVCFEQNV